MKLENFSKDFVRSLSIKLTIIYSANQGYLFVFIATGFICVNVFNFVDGYARNHVIFNSKKFTSISI